MIFLRCAILATVLLLVPASAKAWQFGDTERLHKIEDINLKGADGEPLYLGYKTTVVNFGAGVYLKDDGYILGVTGKSGRYYDFPAGDKLTRFQDDKLLPNPLPPYTISWIDYGEGYLLWIVLIGYAIIHGIVVLYKRRRGQKPEPEAT